MPRSLIALCVWMIACLTLSPAAAQTSNRLELGDPPNQALITISEPDRDGLVTISGETGAVFPNARVLIRNLYTEQTAYVNGGITGSFSVQIQGTPDTPFWISPISGDLPLDQRDLPGSLPGGPGTIVFRTNQTSAPLSENVTQLVLDADVGEWTDRYPLAALTNQTYALRNSESVYIGLAEIPADTEQIRLLFTTDGTTYSLLFDPARFQTAALRRENPEGRDFGRIPASAAQSESGAELRFDVDLVRPNASTITLNRVDLLNTEGAALETRDLDLLIQQNEEEDGITRSPSPLAADTIPFAIGGPVARGASYWTALGRTSSLEISDGSPRELRLELDVTLNAASLPADLTNASMIGKLRLQPITRVFEEGEPGLPIPALNSSNGWSNLQTPSGLPVENVLSEIELGFTETPGAQVLRRDNQLSFPLDFELAIPDDLPDGLYKLVFNGYIRLSGQNIPWETNGVFGTGEGMSRNSLIRLPGVLNLGGGHEQRLIWSLFYDTPSQGSRGLVAEEDREYANVSGRVRFNSPTYILPPRDPRTGELIPYPLEPYLLNVMPNNTDTTNPPLLNFLLPSGRLSVVVTAPDGTVRTLDTLPFAQNQLSTVERFERDLYGVQSPVDVYRLTTRQPEITGFTFDQYGDYEIDMHGMVEDRRENTYEGGGTYRVLIAEQLEMRPGVLSGTPFEVGDAFNPVLHISPAIPADVTITVTVYPLDGSEPKRNTLLGTANRYGYFYSAEEVLRFSQPGEYTIDYEARFTDDQGRLWAGSLRSAGVIATPETRLVAHGERGGFNLSSPFTPAWYGADRLSEQTIPPGARIRPNAPYHSGDIVWLEDGGRSGLYPVVSLQDGDGVYRDWLLENAPVDSTIPEDVVHDELPVAVFGQDGQPYGASLFPESLGAFTYGYISAQRPGVSVRQFVQGGDNLAWPLYTDLQDPYNRQIGAGLAGDAPGDYFFIFGGVVARLNEPELATSAIYASVASVVSPDDPAGTRVYPPFRGQAGGADGGPLLTVNGRSVEMFFHPTGVQPGQILYQGDVLSISGQVAPTLASFVNVRITSPSGLVRQFSAEANAIGYFYQPEQDLLVDELGVWRVQITTRHEGLTSAGVIFPPAPTGDVLGTQDGTFSIYVVPLETETLTWTYPEIFPPALPYNFSFPVPQGWTDVEAYHTLTMPGYVMLDAPLTVTGGSFAYQYSPTQLKRTFPNWENDQSVDGEYVSDPLTLTIIVMGTDAEGTPRAQARIFVLRHDRMLSLNPASAPDEG